MVKDIWTGIHWNVVTTIGFSEIGDGGECAVHISGSGYQRILCMTPNKGNAELIVALLEELWNESK